MPPSYRGEIKIQGRTLRGWLANAADPAERVAFDLVIDDEERGHYVADRPYLALERYRAFGDGAHGFALQMDREWISGGIQNVTLAVGGVPTVVEFHAALGPAATAYFDDDAEPPRKRTPAETKALRELAECRNLRKSAPTEAERAKSHRRYFEILEGLSAADSSANAWRSTILLAREYYDLGRFKEAEVAAARVLAAEPGNYRALYVRGRSLIGLNRPREAHTVFAHALAQQPDSAGARFYAQMTETLSLGEPGADALTVGQAALDRGDPSHLAERIARLPFDWVRFRPGKAEHTAALNAPMLHQVGCVKIGTGAVTYWRRDALVGLAESGLIGALEENELARWSGFYSSANQRGSNGKRRVALLSRDNAIDADDVNRSLIAIANEYRAGGYEPVIVNLGGASLAASTDGIEHAHVEETVGALRRFVLTEGIALVHAVSGTGYIAADALAFTNISFVYGIHFSWDMMDAGDTGDSDQDSGEPQPRPEFDYILSRAATVYATSPEMRDMVETLFRVRCPILPMSGKASP